MQNRIKIDQLEPLAYEAVFGLESYMQQAKLSKAHYELIKIRASQINGCAFCINMHTEEAIKMGEKPKRLFLLDAWKHAQIFTEEEKVILQITEEVTLIHENGLTDETYDRAKIIFDDHYITQIIMAIATINVWNRLAISTLKPI
ncbi:carboxymuconolactone decarboxylase family protein [Flagellimonas nanhaiensis]|uniref:Carboxymuconolactone decarboxylase family protein n=1 Tax=Flagellimonas nanhaiensis TaxID=2292706 RepID=A0A371JTW7_9FLAO|nr:carboxymuconolactone decarboxylase family protein [Allomuricauda nanhaiensis]RDY61244.1 carboxymuconolactone decarboxylase family protein [Allomuricauda nanhaiensis]